VVNPQLGPDYDLAQRLAKLERLVAGLASENALDNASANQRDGTPGLTITQDAGGGLDLRVNHTDGGLGPDGQHPAALKVGEYFDPAGGSVGTGVGALRADTSTAFYVGRLFVGSNPTVSVFDDRGGAATIANPGNIVFGTDGIAQWGLSNPWLSLGPSASTLVGGAGWQSLTNTSWTPVFDCFFVLQHPKVAYNVAFNVPAGLVGQFRVTAGPAFGTLTTIDSWSITGPVASFRTQGFSGYGAGFAVPGASAAQYGSLFQIHVDAYISSGAGTIQVATPTFAGRQS
jgi:hypothetical protein